MGSALYDISMTVVTAGVALRAAGVVGAFMRTFLTREKFVEFRLGWVEAATLPEPLLLLAVTWSLFRDAPDPASVTALQTAAAAGGAALVLAGWGLLLWSWFSWRSLFAGHGVLEGHRLVTGGAYGLVRHPVYLGVFLKWIGLALAYESPVAAAITATYVIPIYLLYIRSEETMMVEHFGQAYRGYRRAVPMLIPGLRA